MIHNILRKLRGRMVVVVESEDGMSTVEYSNVNLYTMVDALRLSHQTVKKKFARRTCIADILWS